MTGRETTSPLHLDGPSTLSRTLDATLHLGNQVELAVLLRLVVEAARSLCGARFGAIWVLDEQRTMLSEFIHTGRRSGGGGGSGFGEAIGQTLPDGQPPARLASDPVLVRLVHLDLEDHPHTIGFPRAHPDTAPFLRFPINVHGQSSGSLYLTEKEQFALEFTDDDEVTVTVLAMAAGIAVENARSLEHAEGPFESRHL
jgi:GAF domain-containing protein